MNSFTIELTHEAVQEGTRLLYRDSRARKLAIGILGLSVVLGGVWVFLHGVSQVTLIIGDQDMSKTAKAVLRLICTTVVGVAGLIVSRMMLSAFETRFVKEATDAWSSALHGKMQVKINDDDIMVQAHAFERRYLFDQVRKILIGESSVTLVFDRSIGSFLSLPLTGETTSLCERIQARRHALRQAAAP